jgi:hypothetical protein
MFMAEIRYRRKRALALLIRLDLIDDETQQNLPSYQNFFRMNSQHFWFLVDYLPYRRAGHAGYLWTRYLSYHACPKTNYSYAGEH